jgi:hypothetical protein
VLNVRYSRKIDVGVLPSYFLDITINFYDCDLAIPDMTYAFDIMLPAMHDNNDGVEQVRIGKQKIGFETLIIGFRQDINHPRICFFSRFSPCVTRAYPEPEPPLKPQSGQGAPIRYLNIFRFCQKLHRAASLDHR